MEQPQPQQAPQASRRSRKWWVIGIIVLVILAGGGFAFYAATSSSTVPAQLHVESPAVTVNGQSVSGNVELDEGDVVATETGRASVLLYESVVVLLEPQTTVTIDELVEQHPKVSMDSGDTFSTFTKLAGIVDYSISTDKAVASVRGTAFELTEGKVVTGEGSVEYNIGGQTFTVSQGRVVELVDGVPVERDATPEELARVIGFMERSVRELAYLRQLEIDKHPVLVSTFMAMYGVDDAFVQQKLDDADQGLLDVDELVAKSPIDVESVHKVADITKAIQRINADIASLNG